MERTKKVIAGKQGNEKTLQMENKNAEESIGKENLTGRQVNRRNIPIEKKIKSRKNGKRASMKKRNGKKDAGCE